MASNRAAKSGFAAEAHSKVSIDQSFSCLKFNRSLLQSDS